MKIRTILLSLVLLVTGILVYLHVTHQLSTYLELYCPYVRASKFFTCTPNASEQTPKLATENQNPNAITYIEVD